MAAGQGNSLAHLDSAKKYATMPTHDAPVHQIAVAIVIIR